MGRGGKKSSENSKQMRFDEHEYEQETKVRCIEVFILKKILTGWETILYFIYIL